MAALFLFLLVLIIILLLLLGMVYVVITVQEHMSESAEAAKAIYDHVFLPVFVGTHRAAEPKEEPAQVPEIDPSEFL